MWTVLFLVLKAQLAMTESIEELDTTPSQIIFMFHSSHLVVVHYENSTSYIVNTLLAQGFNWIIYFVNHDIFRNFLRPYSESVLNVVVLNNHSFFLQYSCTSYNVEQEDVVLFIDEGVKKADGSLPVWRDAKREVTWTNALVYILEKSKLYYYCNCCGKKSGILQEINVTQVPALLKTFRICYDFNGRVFKIAYILYEPFFWCKKSSDDFCYPQGLEGKILKQGSKKFNFKLSMTHFFGKNPWKQLMQEVQKGKYDFAVGGISITDERADYADWSTFLSAEDYVIVFAVKANAFESLTKILKPFSGKLWVGLLTTVLVVHLFLWINAERLRSSTNQSQVTTLKLIVLKSIFEQPSVPFIIKRTDFRLLLFLWFFFVICMTSLYKGMLTSRLVKPAVYEPTTLKELLYENYTFQLGKLDWTALKYHLEHTGDPEHEQLLNRARDDMEFCDSIQKALRENVAVVEERNFIDYTLSRYCMANLTEDQFLQLRVIKTPLYRQYHSIPFKKMSLLGKPISHHLYDMKASGIISRWWNNILQLKLKEVHQDNTGHTVLELSRIYSVLVLYLAGNILAICVFLYEILTYKRQKFTCKKNLHRVITV